MPLKVDNFFHYYMFNLNAKELSSGERLKATIAAVAIGVFSFGLIPLICRISFYDKSFKIKTADEEGKTSKVAEKLQQEKGRQQGGKSNEKTVQKTRQNSSSRISSKKTVEVPKDLSKLSVSELKELAHLLTADQLASIDLFHIRDDEDRFNALFNPEEPKTKEAIQKLPNPRLMIYNKVFSKNHWKCLTDDQVCYVLNYSIPKLQLAVDALFNEDPARHARIKLDSDQKAKIAIFLKIKKAPPKEEVKTFPDLSTLSAKEISNLVQGKTSTELLEVLGAQEKFFDDKEKFKAFFDMTLPVAVELFKDILESYLTSFTELFSDEHWDSLDEGQAKQLILNLKDPKLAIEKLLKDEARFKSLNFTIIELEKIKPFLTPNLLQIVTDAHKERLANLENFSIKELWDIARVLTDSEALNYDFNKVKNKEPSNLKEIVKALYPFVYDKRKDRCIPQLSNEQIALMCNGFAFQHWECLNDDQALKVNLSLIVDEKDREDAAIALFFIDKNIHRLPLLNPAQKKEIAECIKVQKYHLSYNQEHFPNFEEKKPIEVQEKESQGSEGILLEKEENPAEVEKKESQGREEISLEKEEKPVGVSPSDQGSKIKDRIPLEELPLEELEKCSPHLSDEEILGFDFSKVKSIEDKLPIFRCLYDKARFNRLLTSEKIYELVETANLWMYFNQDQLIKLDLERLSSGAKKNFIVAILMHIFLYKNHGIGGNILEKMEASLKDQIKDNLDEDQKMKYGDWFN